MAHCWQTLRGPFSAVSKPIFAIKIVLHTRRKVLDEICKINILLHRSDLKISVTVRRKFYNLYKNFTMFYIFIKFVFQAPIVFIKCTYRNFTEFTSIFENPILKRNSSKFCREHKNLMQFAEIPAKILCILNWWILDNNCNK